MQHKEKKILLLVEGKSLEAQLFSKILECFPEINVEKKNIVIYNTNLFALNQELTKEFGEKWYEEEIDFLGFLKSSSITKDQIRNLQNEQDGSLKLETLSFTDIFLVFDYERQDHLFDVNRIKNMLKFWNESTENGLLYINYPMIEAYKHLQEPLPDTGYLTKKCNCSILFSKENKKNKYKQIVGTESSFTDIKKYSRQLIQQFVIHNLCKASAITTGTTEISHSIAKQYWDNRNYVEILDVENLCSSCEQTGFVYVLATCLFFIPEYNSCLIFDN